jgi:hypothetical protein
MPLDDPDPDLPTGPNDPACLQFPGNAVCQGGPAPAPMPPMPHAPEMPMTGGVPGMPGHI